MHVENAKNYPRGYLRTAKKQNLNNIKDLKVRSHGIFKVKYSTFIQNGPLYLHRFCLSLLRLVAAYHLGKMWEYQMLFRSSLTRTTD